MPSGRKGQNEKQRVQKLIMAETFPSRSADCVNVWVCMLPHRQTVKAPVFDAGIGGSNPPVAAIGTWRNR